MHPLTPEQLLRVWEDGQTRAPVERALLLLAQASPGETWEALAALPIGLRDDRLLTLREWAFGTLVSGMSPCPACGEKLELSFNVPDLRAPALPLPEDGWRVAAAGYEVRFRLPDSTDLAALLREPDPDARRARLLERCLLDIRYEGREEGVDCLPPRVVDAVVRRMEEVDPAADLHTALECPECAHAWGASFDILTFFWAEIEAWAYRTLRDVHVLATAYSWREADILALSPWRRELYLRMAHR